MAADGRLSAGTARVSGRDCQRQQASALYSHRRSGSGCPQAIPLLSGIEAGCVITDEEYESNKIPAFILANGATAVIPPKSNRGDPCEYDRQRILIERTFDKLKRWRRIATR